MSYFDISGAVTIGKNSTEGCLTLYPAGKGLRTRLSTQLYTELGNPTKLTILEKDGKLILMKPLTAGSGTKVSDDRVIYDADAAARIAELAGIDFKAIIQEAEVKATNGEKGSKSVHVGTYEFQPIDENTQVAVISFTVSE